MPMPSGTRYRVKTYKSGKRVRLAIAPNGRVLEVKELTPRTDKTRTGRRLERRRRRIGR